MFLMQILLPRFDNHGVAFPEAWGRAVTHELMERFGGVTAYARAPAQGSWRSDEGETHHDDVIVVEVMIDDLDERWWRAYRRKLQKKFRQKALIVRAQPMVVL